MIFVVPVDVRGAHPQDEQRRRRASAVNAAEVATFEWDVDGDRLWGDANFHRMFGLPAVDGPAPIARFVAMIHPDDREHVMASVRRTVETGVDYEEEYRIGDGEDVRWVIARGRLERDDAQGTVRFPGVLLDITERHKLADHLERQSRMYDAILSHTDDLVSLFDREGRTLFANRRQLELWNRTLDEAVGLRLPELGYAEWEWRMHERELALVVETAGPIRGEVNRNGLVYEYIFSPVLNAAGEVEAISTTTRDITARRREEAARTMLSDQLQLALQAANMGSWHLDVASGRITVDERARSLLGLAVAEDALENLVAMVVDEDRPRVFDLVEAAIDPNIARPYSTEVRLRRADGEIRWIAAEGQPTLQADGDHWRTVSLGGTIRDITDAKAAQDALRESEARFRELARRNEQLLESERVARGEAETASRVKDEFLATLSHELRTPLSAILGWSQILGRGVNDEQELLEGLAVIEQNARTQGRIIEDLLDMSRILSGKMRLEMQPIDLSRAVSAAVETVTPAAAAKGVRIVSHFEPVAINGDAGRLQQVFWNLLTNAVKFTPRDGRIEVSMQRLDGHVEVSVLDSGEGITAEFLPYVFDRFRQADASTTRHHAGLGLGLAIVRNLTEMHGGSVRVASAGAGTGARFTVSLPLLVARRLAESRASIATAEEEVAGLRVLVVDDDADTLRIVKRLLEEHHAEVTTASSAAEALHLLDSARFDVLVSDIGMPGEDGHSLVRRMRLGEHSLPAIAVSAYARTEDHAKSLDAGFTAHLVKPVDAAVLVAAVARAARREQ